MFTTIIKAILLGALCVGSVSGGIKFVKVKPIVLEGSTIVNGEWQEADQKK